MSRSADPAAFFRSRLLLWFAHNARRFPWRETQDAYAVMIAELMLRRTQARQVVPVYLRFLERFPTVATLAAADPGELAKLVQPLGLAWRVPAFTDASRAVVERFQGIVSRGRRDLMSLPGVGDYVADAIRVFAYGERTAVLETNTVRVAGRYLGFETRDSSRRRESVRREVERLVDRHNPRAGNAALLDFASAVCIASRPRCEVCPMALRCAWRIEHRPELGAELN